MIIVSSNPKVVKVRHGLRLIVSTKKGDFDPRTFLAAGGEGKQLLFFAKGRPIFIRGMWLMPSSTFSTARFGLQSYPRQARKQGLA
jgi:hypothetical protein